MGQGGLVHAGAGRRAAGVGARGKFVDHHALEDVGLLIWEYRVSVGGCVAGSAIRKKAAELWG